MSKGGIGFGSAALALIFAVLCLTIFALITLATARNDKALADAEARLVIGYYEADTLAETIIAEILAADTRPAAVNGVGIAWDSGADGAANVGIAANAASAEFCCPISDNKELYVKIALAGDAYDILDWRMRSTGAWNAEAGLPVWSGE